MVVVDLSLEEMLEHIEFQSGIRYDYIVPSEFDGCPKLTEWRYLTEFDLQEIIKNQEAPKNSDLWSQFVSKRYQGDKEITALINNRVNEPNKGKGIRFIGVALENAFIHGNKNNPNLPVSLKAFEGRKGVIIRIRDTGYGFDFKKAMVQYMKVRKRSINFWSHPENIPEELKWFTRLGRGFYSYMISIPRISFENGGNTINIMYEDYPNMCEILRLMEYKNLVF